MYADQYTNYGMNFGSDKVSDSIVNIRLGQCSMCVNCVLLLLSPHVLIFATRTELNKDKRYK